MNSNGSRRVGGAWEPIRLMPPIFFCLRRSLWVFVGCRCKGSRYLIFFSIGRQREWAYGSHFDSLLLLRRGNVVRIVTDWHRGAMTCCFTRLVRRVYETGAFIPLQIPRKDFVVFASARGSSYMKVLLFLQPDLA